MSPHTCVSWFDYERRAQRLLWGLLLLQTTANKHPTCLENLFVADNSFRTWRGVFRASDLFLDTALILWNIPSTSPPHTAGVFSIKSSKKLIKSLTFAADDDRHLLFLFKLSHFLPTFIILINMYYLILTAFTEYFVQLTMNKFMNRSINKSPIFAFQFFRINFKIQLHNQNKTKNSKVQYSKWEYQQLSISLTLILSC